jgi:hypothetical protein
MGSRTALYGNSLRHEGEKTGADLRARAGPGLDRKNVLESCLKRQDRRFDRRFRKRCAMAVGAVLSDWVMELGVLTLIGLV